MGRSNLIPRVSVFGGDAGLFPVDDIFAELALPYGIKGFYFFIGHKSGRLANRAPLSSCCPGEE
jgi:hypothetical protein